MWRSRIPCLSWPLAILLLLAVTTSVIPVANADRPGFRVSLVTDKPVYASGEPIRIVFEIANHTETPVRLDFASAQRFDVAIADEAGTEVWRWSAGRMFAQMLGQEFLGSEWRSLTYEAMFTGVLSPGPYRIKAWLTDGSGDFSATLGIQVQ